MPTEPTDKRRLESEIHILRSELNSRNPSIERANKMIAELDKPSPEPPAAEMINPTQDDIGRSVVYDKSGRDREIGVLISFNDQYAFVRYGSDSNSKATRFSDLDWQFLSPKEG